MVTTRGHLCTSNGLTMMDSSNTNAFTIQQYRVHLFNKHEYYWKRVWRGGGKQEFHVSPMFTSWRSRALYSNLNQSSTGCILHWNHQIESRRGRESEGGWQEDDMEEMETGSGGGAPGSTTSIQGAHAGTCVAMGQLNFYTKNTRIAR